MKSHELARYLLQRSDSEVLIETSTGRDVCKVVTKAYRTLTKLPENCLVLIQPGHVGES